MATAGARVEQVLADAAGEAERTVSRAQADAVALMRRSVEEIAALHEQAEARIHALEDDLARLADARRTLLADAKGLAVTLTPVVADAETAAQEGTDSPVAVPPEAEKEAERPRARG